MTTVSAQDRVAALFTEAREVHAQALERLEPGDISGIRLSKRAGHQRGDGRADPGQRRARAGDCCHDHRGTAWVAQDFEQRRDAGWPVFHTNQLPARIVLLRRDMRSVR